MGARRAVVWWECPPTTINRCQQNCHKCDTLRTLLVFLPLYLLHLSSVLPQIYLRYSNVRIDAPPGLRIPLLTLLLVPLPLYCAMATTRDIRDEFKIVMLPEPHSFAVVRMDPVAMVSHLNLDPVALKAAQAMRPKKYLVYLDIVRVHHFRYVWPVCLRFNSLLTYLSRKANGADSWCSLWRQLCALLSRRKAYILTWLCQSFRILSFPRGGLPFALLRTFLFPLASSG